MAKSKTQQIKSKTRHVEDDEPQMKSRDEAAEDEAVEEAEDIEEAEDVEDADDAEATELDADEPDGEATELDADEADANEDAEPEPDADDDAVAEDEEDEDEEDEEESVDEGPKAPPAKITKFAALLIFLNWNMAGVFMIVAWMDAQVRTHHAYLTTLNYVQVYGLPLKSEEAAPSIAYETRPMLNLTTAQLREAFRSRPGVNKTAVVGSVDFAPFDETLDKRVPFRLRPSDMTAEVLRDAFQGQEKPVATLDEEIDHLKETLPAEIEKAATEAKEAISKWKDDDKRAYVKRALMPFSWDTQHAKKVEAQIDGAQGPDLDAMVKRTVIRTVLFPVAAGKARDKDVWLLDKLEDQLEKAKDAKDLDKLLDDALQRRIYYDILAPVNVFRPGDIKDALNYKIEKLADYPLDKVQEFLQLRLSAAIAETYDPDHHFGKDYYEDAGWKVTGRDAVERRQKVGFILFTLSQVSVPIVERKLYPKGMERAQTVCGILEFSNSSIYYVRTLRILEERVNRAIVAERDGLIADIKDKKDAVTNTKGFIGAYEEEIDRLVKIRERIDTAEKRLADLTTQKNEYQKIYEVRVKQHKDVLQKLLDARQETEKDVKKLRVLQDQLHTALVDLSEAGERLFRLHDEIQIIETRLGQEAGAAKKGKKGKANP